MKISIEYIDTYIEDEFVFVRRGNAIKLSWAPF